MVKSAVDQGINPYGRPAKGNYDEAWDYAKNVPCSKCGAKSKTLTISEDRIVIRCITPIPNLPGERSYSETLIFEKDG